MPYKPRLKPVLISILTIIAATWLGLCVILYLFQDRLIFQPTAALASSPGAIGLDYEDVSLTSGATELHGWFVPATQPRGVVLFLHGNAGNISHRLATLEILHELKLSTFIVDYRGYGESQGRPSETGTYHDAETAWNYLTMERGIEPDNIIIFGRSLGGAVATWLAARVKPAGVILESTFTSMEALAKKFYPYVPVGLLLRNEYPVEDNIIAVTAPLLIIHSHDDELVPYNHAETLHRTANGNSELHAISGDHNEGFLLSGDDYVERLRHFSSRVLN